MSSQAERAAYLQSLGQEALHSMTVTPIPNHRAHAERLAKIFKEVDWLIPAFKSVGFLNTFANQIERTPPAARPEVMRMALADVYNPRYLASMVLERYSKIMHVRDFSRQIDEAIKAYFAGYKFVAVTAMVPIFEGIVRKLATRQNRDVGQGTRKLVAEFDALVEHETNSPRRYEERLVMLEVLRDFIRDRFLENTKVYSGLNEFNRHGILHGIFERYGEDINFFRAITLLDLLCFSISLIEGGSGFSPDHTPESEKLAAHYVQLQQTAASGP
jgi:hypothetical protein